MCSVLSQQCSTRSFQANQWQGRWTLPDLPPHLLERLRPPERPAARLSEPLRTDRSLSAWAARALDDEAQQVRSAAAGGRNHRLNRAAFSLGQIVATGLLDAESVTDHLHQAALGAGLGAREARLTIRSGLDAGMLRPRLPATAAAASRLSAVDAGIDLDVGSASI